MSLIPKALAPAALLLVHLNAPAAHLDFTLSATFEMPQLASGPLHTTVTFSLDEPVTTVQQVPGVALLATHLVEWTVSGSSGTVVTPTFAQVGWFRYPGANYHGIDLRLPGTLPSGDLFQFIWLLPMSPYEGTDTAPEFQPLSLQSLGGSVCYYATGSGACTYTDTFSDGGYTVDGAAVPEPATAWLLLPGLAGLVGWRRRAQRQLQRPCGTWAVQP